MINNALNREVGITIVKFYLLQEDETIFEYLVSDYGEWIHWSEKVPEFIYPSNEVLKYYAILVPNIDNTRTLFLIDTIAKQKKAVLLIGMRFSNI